MTTLVQPAIAPGETDQLRQMIEQELPDLVAIRRDLHAHPELGYEEHRTSQIVQRELRKAGVEFVAGLAGGTGVMAHVRSTNDPNGHHAIALRADMDALPIEEQSTLPYRSSVPGKMHACGHDGHTAILLGAARVLSKLSRHAPLPRPVSFIFQPAEEGGAGGHKLVQEGCLAGKIIGPPIQHMFGLHGWPALPLGVLGTRVGPLLAASDRFDVVVKGIGSHAAFPHFSRDPVVAAAAIVNALQTIASRNVDPLDSVVVSVTMLHAGSAYNVIPTRAQISGTVRTLTSQVMQLTQRRILEIATNVARAHGCEAAFEYRIGYPVTLNDHGAVNIFNTIAKAAFGEERVLDLPQPVMGGEDFAFYSQVVPSCFFVLGLIPPGATSMPSLHQPDFDFNDDAIATGVEIFCRLALRPALPPPTACGLAHSPQAK
jgi:amidohydrolase